MAEIWKPQSINVYKAWVSSIIDESGDILTSWETSFVDSIAGQLEGNRQLSQKQAEILERIYTEKTK